MKRMSSQPEQDYTASERLLLSQFDLLDEIKEGKRPLKKTAAEQQLQRSRPATATTAVADTKGVAISASGLKQPSRIRLKQTKPQSTPPASPPRSAGTTATAAGADKPAGATTVPSLEPGAAATISKEALAAALAKKLAEQRQKQQQAPQQAAAAPAEPAGAAAAPAAPAQGTAPGRSFREAHKARQQLPAAPSTPTASDPMSVEPQQDPQQEPQPAPAATGGPAAKSTDIDYDAVSSPEYDVDYDAVSSPVYDGVSQPHRAHQHGKQQQQRAGSGTLGGPAPSTPEHPHAAKSPADTPSTTPPAQHRGSTMMRPSDRRPDRSSRGTRSRSRSRSRYGSRSPDARQDRYRRSCSRSPDRHPSQRGVHRSSTRTRSRSRSPSPGQHRQRSWTRSRSRSHHRPRSTRSRSRSPSYRYGSRSRRPSPDYGLGPGGVSTGGRSRSPGPATAAPEEGEVELEPGSAKPNSSDGGLGGPRPRSRKQQPQQQPGCTLFVGDLPPVGFTSTDLQGLFAAFGWNVVSARVMGSQCYGFVEFGTELEAEQALQLVQDKDPGFSINGGFIRASRAKGTMPRWKQGKAVLSKRDRGQGLEGLEAYEHPTARLVRLQATAALAAASQGVRDLDAAPAGLGLPAAALPGPLPLPLPPLVAGSAPQQQGRPIIDYGDL